ncbi:MAG: NHLP bacteriocin export ABC transporter permease/ATPase subunit, partial [Acidobacteriota bacterium]
KELRRFGQRAAFDRSSLEQAYGRLSSVLGGRQPRGIESTAVSSDRLLEVCRQVGKHQGLVLRPPAEGPDGPGDAEVGVRLGRICAASRLRYRRVILRGEWWRRDNGPLLAFWIDESEKWIPVAVLPTSPTSYRVTDPQSGVEQTVDEATSERLAGQAYMFYPSLPERSANFLDLVRMALFQRSKDVATIFAMGAVGGILSLLVPILTGHIFGNVIPDADRGRLFQMVLALVVAAIAAAAFQITRAIAVLRISGKVDGSLQTAVWDRLLSLPISFYRYFSVGDLADRSTGIDVIREQILGTVMNSLLSALFSVFSLGLLFYYSWELALIACGLLALLILVSGLLTSLQLRHERAVLTIQGRIASLLFGLINGIAKLRSSGAEARAYSLWAESFSQQRHRTFKAQTLANVQATWSAVFTTLSALVIFGAMGSIETLGLSLSGFLAFYAALGQLQAAAVSLVTIFSSSLAILPIWERLQPILKARPEVDASKIEVTDLAGDIEFSQVSFRYQADGPLILDNVSFRARPGEFIALVGSSGAGKSTCLRLLIAFERPISGSIYYDGQDLPSLDMPSLRRRLGVVLQDGRPMSGDIYSNIVGNSNLGIDAAWEAARMAGLDEDIRAMPMGMHTVISEGAGTFSGGQKQRLLIARALVNRPRVLFFDEATSALDNRTQDIVSQSLEQLKATRIVVAHRLSTIQNADRIYYFHDGRILESGTYDELLLKNGQFARLAERQTA